MSVMFPGFSLFARPISSGEMGCGQLTLCLVTENLYLSNEKYFLGVPWLSFGMALSALL